MRLKIVSLILLLLSVTLHAQPKVVTLRVGSSTSYIGGFVDLNHVYISLDDMARGLGLHSFTLQSTGKLSIYSKYGSLLFTPNNNFIMVSVGSDTKIYQLPIPILLADGKLYMPADHISDYFTRILGGKLSYDEQNGVFTLSVLNEVPPEIAGVDVKEKENGAVIEIPMRTLPTAYSATIAQGNMLYVTLMPAVADTQRLNSLPPTAVYSQIIAIQNPSSVQLSFKLKRSYISSQVTMDSVANTVIISLYSQANVKQILSDEIKRKLQAEKNNWKLGVIVIDPGHGGKDPGAIGVTGIEEKNVTLAIAKDLKRDLNERLPDVKVVLTRTTDKFVPLDERGEIANKVHGKLFISIHCNSMPTRPNPAHGVETFFLRPGKTSEAIRIAAQENAAIKYENDYEKKYKSYDADNMILTAMAHSAYVKYSERLAELIEKDVSSVAHLDDNGVSQAGFYVLIGASMPAVLVETGYLSNLREERSLASRRGQRLIARGLTDAIVQYRAEYEKNFAEN